MPFRLHLLARFVILTLTGMGISFLLYLLSSWLTFPAIGHRWLSDFGVLIFLVPLFTTCVLVPVFTFRSTKEMFLPKATNWPVAGYLLYFGVSWGFSMAMMSLIILFGADQNTTRFMAIAPCLFLAGLAGGCFYGWGHRKIFSRPGI